MKILIVDDSRAMRSIVIRCLRQAGFGDHSMVQAASGKEALDQIRSSKPGLVLADWNMPEMNGIELLEALKAAGVSIPFGFITTECSQAMRERATGAGARFFITKPFTVETLQEHLTPLIH